MISRIAFQPSLHKGSIPIVALTTVTIYLYDIQVSQTVGKKKK